MSQKRLTNYVAQVSSILNSETDFLNELITTLPKETEAQQIVHRFLGTLNKLSKVKL